MEQNTNTAKATFITPWDKEKMEAIIKATCEYYHISEEELKTASTTMDSTDVRRICFYLILTNTEIKDRTIAARLNSNRSSVFLARDIIQTRRKIYEQTANNIKGIVAIANTFDKTTTWLIR